MPYNKIITLFEYLRHKWQQFKDSPDALLAPLFAVIGIAIIMVIAGVILFSIFELMR